MKKLYVVTQVCVPLDDGDEGVPAMVDKWREGSVIRNGTEPGILAFQVEEEWEHPDQDARMIRCEVFHPAAWVSFMEAPGDPRGFLEATSIARLIAASQGLVHRATHLACGDFEHEGLAEQSSWEALEVAMAETRAALAAFLPGPPELKTAGLGKIIQAREAIEQIVAQPFEPDWSYAVWEARNARIQAVEDQLRTAGLRLLAFSVGDGRATYALGPTAGGWTMLTWPQRAASGLTSACACVPRPGIATRSTCCCAAIW